MNRRQAIALGSATAITAVSGCAASRSSRPTRHVPSGGGVSIFPPDAQQTATAFTDTVTFLLSPEDTRGQVTLANAACPPGGGPPPHLHPEDDEFFIVISGSAEFLVYGRWRPVAAGSSVFIPRGTVHAFHNSGEDTLRCLIGLLPGRDFKRMFLLAAEEFAQPGGPDPEVIRSICENHGVILVAE